ncbi:MAG: hypothetical protein Q9220_002352 [cf. Caloplaca sp. 1 TL-2023]
MDANTVTTAVPPSPFKTILNFRDVGQTINDLQCSPLVEVSEPTSTTRTEHIQQGKNYDAKVRDLAVSMQPEHASVMPMRIPIIQYREINLNGRSYERALLSQLRYASLGTEAICILGREVIQPGGLIGQAIDSIHSSGAELKLVFDVLADVKNYPVFFHCTSGKDRTGLVALLLLRILETPLEVISVDYVASQERLTPEREFRIRELKAMGLSDDFADCPPDWVFKVVEYIRRTYGSETSYFDGIGVDEAMRHAIRTNMMA